MDRGDLTVSQATEIFENMRSALINAKAWEMEEGLADDNNQKKIYNGNINFKNKT